MADPAALPVEQVKALEEIAETLCKFYFGL